MPSFIDPHSHITAFASTLRLAPLSGAAGFDQLRELLRAFLEEHPADIGVIATPARVAQQVAQQMIEGGVRALWNFAPMDLKVPEGVVANNVHLTDSLLVLTYRLHQMEAREEAAPQNNLDA